MMHIEQLAVFFSLAAIYRCLYCKNSVQPLSVNGYLAFPQTSRQFLEAQCDTNCQTHSG